MSASLPEGERVYRLELDAQDAGGRRSAQGAEVVISVTGPGYNPPVFLQSMYRFPVLEDIGQDKFVGKVAATYAGTSTGDDWFHYVVLVMKLQNSSYLKNVTLVTHT